MSSIRFEPIAVQLCKQVPLDGLLPRDALEALREALPREALPSEVPSEALPSEELPRESSTAAPSSAPLELECERFQLHYRALAAAAFRLLGAPQFDRLSKLYDRILEEFMPGGPPASPVYDSYALQHILAEVPQGLAGETPYSVLARLLEADPAREPLQRLAHALSVSHLDLYRVSQVAHATRADLERIRDRHGLCVQTTGPFLRDGDLVLARVLPFGEHQFIADSPYLLRAPEPHWQAYFERVRSQTAVASSAATARDRRPAAHAKLTPKRRARLDQQKKQRERAQTPEAALLRHLEHGPSERYWLDFIMAAYAGERRGIVYLAGIPDRPETLPHHDDYDPATAAEFGAPPRAT